MGAQCSCTAEPNGLTLEEVIPMSKPKLLVNNALVSRSVNLTAVAPLSKTSGDSEIEFEEEVGEIPVAKKESPVTKMLSRMKTNDPEATSQRDDSNDLLKKATSFFRFSSLESRYQANPIEHANEVHGDVWKLQNIKLKSIIQMSQGKYLWEAHNISNDKRCTVKISLIEASRLSHSNFAKTENFLRELGGISNPNVIDIYSFSIFESEFHNKPYLVVVVVQEPVKCSLRDVHNHKTEQETLWDQNQLLIIIRDIYAGLVACKEKHLIHGRLVLENALVSEDLERVLVGDFNIKLPLVKENKTTSSMGVVRFSKNSLGGTFLVPENAAHTQIIPDEKDIHDLVVLVLKLMTNDENIGYSFDLLKKDERYRRAYQKVFEALDLVTSRVRNPLQVINDVTHLIDKNHKKLCLDIPEDFDNKCQQESYVDLVFLKIDCYELLNQHGTALEVYSELISILENKDRKGMKEYLEYVKCVNRTIKHYLSLNDWLKAKDICAEMNCILKKDPLLKKTLKQYPKEYINFTFLLGNISEGLGEPDKAIVLYAKGLSFCSNQHLGLEAYSSTLKRISNLYMQKNEHVQALECLKKLVDYYETQEGYFVDRADGYLNMGDILIQQGNLGQAVKMYLRGLDNIKKGKMNNSEALLNIIDKIVSSYKSLHEDENALRYMIDSLEIKRKAFGRESVEYMEEIKEIAAAHVRLQDYDAALNHYLIYQKIAASDPEKKEQYLESLVFVGDSYAELRMYEKARKSFETFASLEKEAKGVESKEFLCSQDKLASIYFKEGKAKESLEIQLNSLILKEKMFTDDDFYMIVSLSNIGDTYFADKQYNQALESHKESLNKLESRQAEFKEEYSQLLLRIALDYDKCGDSGQALKAIHKSLQVSQKEGTESDMTNTIKMYEIMSRGKETRKRSLDFIKLTRQID